MWLGGHSSMLPNDLQKLAADDDVAQPDDALSKVQDDFYREVDSGKLTDDAIRGAVRGLDDRFSFYFDPGEFKRYNEQAEARFSGIGVTVLPHEEGLEISQVYPRSPARKAGLR